MRVANYAFLIQESADGADRGDPRAYRRVDNDERGYKLINNKKDDNIRALSTFDVFGGIPSRKAKDVYRLVRPNARPWLTRLASVRDYKHVRIVQPGYTLHVAVKGLAFRVARKAVDLPFFLETPRLHRKPAHPERRAGLRDHGHSISTQVEARVILER